MTYLPTPETLQPQELIHDGLRVADARLPLHQRRLAAFPALDTDVTSIDLREVWLSPIDPREADFRGRLDDRHTTKATDRRIIAAPTAL